MRTLHFFLVWGTWVVKAAAQPFRCRAKGVSTSLGIPRVRGYRLGLVLARAGTTISIVYCIVSPLFSSQVPPHGAQYGPFPAPLPPARAAPNTEQIKASVDHGVLTVTVPKVQEKEPEAKAIEDVPMGECWHRTLRRCP